MTRDHQAGHDRLILAALRCAAQTGVPEDLGKYVIELTSGSDLPDPPPHLKAVA